MNAPQRGQAVEPGCRPRGAAAGQAPGGRITNALATGLPLPSASQPYILGVLPGEGVGPEVIDASLLLVEVLCAHGIDVETRMGGKIGLEAQRLSKQVLTDEVTAFFRSVFHDGGAVLCGPGGGRFVYELRQRFDLYCKLVPLQPFNALNDTGVLRPQAVRGVDILVVRENLAGLYQGGFDVEGTAPLRQARHHFGYSEGQVRRILEVAGAAARMRRGKLAVVTKPGGAPTISQLWNEHARLIAERNDLELRLLEVDNACYQIVADAQQFDVVAAPNMFGDVLADTAGVLLASRGNSYSANYSDAGAAVYQTGHGAAYDLAGSDRANPLGQIQALAMVLRESFGLGTHSMLMLNAIDTVLASGWRTVDIMASGCRQIGTREMGERVAAAFVQCLRAVDLTEVGMG